jgi:iron transport multicopper oxidase
MTIIEVDGVNTQPLVVDSIQIFAGQRYSFVLEANQPVDNYWIRAKPDKAQSTSFGGGLNSAILRYSGSDATADPITNQTTSVIPLVETNLVPLDNAPAPGTPEPGGADVVINLALNLIRPGPTNKLVFTVNNVSFVSPSVPVLLQILSGTMSATDLLPTGSVYTLPANKVVELTIPALSTLQGGPVSYSGQISHFSGADGSFTCPLAPIPSPRSKIFCNDAEEFD